MTGRCPQVLFTENGGLTGNTVTSVSITIPSYCQDGDFIWGYFRVSENPGTVTYPSYITTLVGDATFTVGTNDSRIRLFWFRRDAVAQGSTFTISWTTAQYAAMFLMGVRGVDRTTPFGTLPQNNQTTGSVTPPNNIPYNAITTSDGQLAFILVVLQSDATDEGALSVFQSGHWASSGGNFNNVPFIDGFNNPDFHVDVDFDIEVVQTGVTSLAGGNHFASALFGTQPSTYYTWGWTLNKETPIVTDVDGDETWNDGDTGLVITGQGLAF